MRVSDASPEAINQRDPDNPVVLERRSERLLEGET